jgi:transposase
MLAALIAADRDPHALAGLARKKMRAKTSVLRQLLTGHFTAHHAFLPGMIPGRIDELTAQIDTLTTRIEDAIAPFAPRSPQLDEIPGIGTTTTAQEILPRRARTGLSSPHPGPPGVLATFALKARQSAGRSKAAAARATPGSATPSAKPPLARADQHLPSRPLQAGRRSPRPEARPIAVGTSILTICWHLLSDPDARFTDLGPHWHAGSHPSGAIASSSANWNA